MPSPDDSALLHANLNYDPVQAHEYYLRNRDLKGRKAGVKLYPEGTYPSDPVVRSKVVPRLKKKSNGVVLGKPKMTPVQVKARVSELQKRLAALKVVLADLVKQLKDKGGDATKAATDKASKSVSTSAEKIAAAKSSADYYNKNKTKIANKAKADAAANDASSLDAQIRAIKEKIATMRADLAMAMKR